MPRYTIEGPDGRRITVEGDTPPSDADMDQIFSDANSQSQISGPQQALNKFGGEVTNILGKGMIPGKAIFDIAKGQLGEIDPASQAMGEGFLGAANTAAFGIPKWLAKKGLGTVGLELPEPKSPTAEMVGSGVGMVGNAAAIGRGLSKAVPALAGHGLRRSIARGTIEGGLAGGLQTPESGITDLKARGDQAKIGALVGGVAEPLAMGVGNVLNATVGKTKFAKQIRGDVYGSKKAAGRAFDESLQQATLNNPDVLADLSEPANKLRMLRTFNPEIDAFVNYHPNIKAIVDNPDLARQLNAKQAQDIINTMNSKMSQTKLGGNNVRPQDIPFMEVVDDMKVAQADAYPEMLDARKAYSKNREAFKTVRPDLSKRSMEKRISEGFTTGEVGEEFKNLLPSETFRKLKGAQVAGKVVKALTGPGALIGSGVAVGGAAIAKALSRLRGDG